MGCGNSKEASSPAPQPKRQENNRRKSSASSTSSSLHKNKNDQPPREPSPPPKDPTPPPKDPTPPPQDDNEDDGIKRTYHLMGPPTGYETVHHDNNPAPEQRDPTPEKRDPTPVLRDPTPPPLPPPSPPANNENQHDIQSNEGQMKEDHEVKEDNVNTEQDNNHADHQTEQDMSQVGEQNLSDEQDNIHADHETDQNGSQVGEQNLSDEQNTVLPIPSSIQDNSQQHLDEGDEDDGHQHHHHDEKPDKPKRNHEDSNEGYEKSDYGIYEKCYEFRSNPVPLDVDYSQEPTSVPFVDQDFGPSVAIKGENVEWKRPTEFRSEPVLFSSGMTRFDIGQGSAGTCWFLSTVAMLADKPDLFHRVVPKDAWNIDGGYFYCYFWRFGQWEKVVIDDTLPVIYGDQLWGAKSRDDPNEMWPALLEKAFARFHGNFNSVYGGQSGDAYLALTGGCSEYIDFDKVLENDGYGEKAKALHSRIKNAVKSGSLLCTEVPSEYDSHCGLIGGHAYSLTGATQVVDNEGLPVYLVRVRNPWGHTEWTGAWHDNGPEWDTLPAGKVSHNTKDDGEFFIELRDFIKYFSGVTICSMTPDFDQDGCEDAINVCTTIFGNWQGETAAGFEKRIRNPKFIFEVDDEGMDSDGFVPLVVQICQFLEHRQKNKASIRVDLYKVLAEESDKDICVLQLLGNVTNVYKKERQMSSRHKVEPGQYVVLPSTIDPGMEKDFIVRVFSPSGLIDVREVSRQCSVMSSDNFEAPVVSGVDNKIRFCECKVGSWKAGCNAGGQVSQEKFHCNPQVEFTVPDRGPQMVNVCLMQSSKVSGYPVGVRLFELEDGYEITNDSSHRDYLYNQYENCPKTVEGSQGAFVNGSSAQITHVLEPGRRYFAILHMDEQDTDNDFAVVVRSTCALNLRLHCC